MLTLCAQRQSRLSSVDLSSSSCWKGVGTVPAGRLLQTTAHASRRTSSRSVLPSLQTRTTRRKDAPKATIQGALRRAARDEGRRRARIRIAGPKSRPTRPRKAPSPKSRPAVDYVQAELGRPASSREVGFRGKPRPDVARCKACKGKRGSGNGRMRNKRPVLAACISQPLSIHPSPLCLGGRSQALPGGFFATPLQGSLNWTIRVPETRAARPSCSALTIPRSQSGGGGGRRTADQPPNTRSYPTGRHLLRRD